MSPLFKKLNLSDQDSMLVLNAPASFKSELALLENVRVHRDRSGKLQGGFAIAFAITQVELNTVSKIVLEYASGDAVIWVCYPKKTSKNYRCEFNRDSGWDVLGRGGFEPVRQVAIDADWSALRFRRVEHIKTMTRRESMTISTAGKDRTKRKT